MVCAYNAADTIDDCLSSLATLTYPSFEVIVVNDGSTDATASIARQHASRHPGVRVIDVPKGGLSAARNAGLAAATGEIVAYTDADVRVDPDWLTYLVQPLLDVRRGWRRAARTSCHTTTRGSRSAWRAPPVAPPT